jgi:hypothetical protein
VSVRRISRRKFLGTIGAIGGAAIGLGALAGCGGSSGGGTTDVTAAYRLSTRGKRASQAAKKNAANKLFVSPEAAVAGRAHPGDHARVVRVSVSPADWNLLFGGGASVRDLRHL